MAKIELTTEQSMLYSELKKLAKRANQRILRLERLTGAKGTFASKQLYDYLSSKPVQGLSGKGRIRVSKSFTETQMIAIIKATKEFLESDYSRIKPVTELKKDIEKSTGVKLSYKHISSMYTAQELWKFVDDNYSSEFWKEDAPRIFEMTKTDWVEDLSLRIDRIKDKDATNKLKSIYDYIRKHGLRGVVRID